jgi:hypothetical protein
MRSIFIDECKQVPFLLVGFVSSNFEQHPMRKRLRTMLLPGQRSLHFKSERERRKKEILKVLLTSGCEVIVVQCQTKSNVAARMCALDSMINNEKVRSCNLIVIELDETVRLRDHEFLKRQDSVSEWDHRQRHEEPLLWVADAVAWCVNRGGEWERMVRPMIVQTITC